MGVFLIFLKIVRRSMSVNVPKISSIFSELRNKFSWMRSATVPNSELAPAVA